MVGMSRNMNIPAMQKILMEFEKESGAMDMKEEMMNDAVDDVMEVGYIVSTVPQNTKMDS